MRLIGVSGMLESGKDTVADILIKNHGYYKVSVGYHIRVECIHLDDSYLMTKLCHWMPKSVWDTAVYLHSLPLEKAYDLVFSKSTTPAVRDLLQWYGQWRYAESESYWLDKIRVQIRSIQATGEHTRIVVPDVRRANEFEMCQSHGETWCVVRSRCLSKNSTKLSREALGHITETVWKELPFKQYIINNGNLEDLEKLVGMIVKEYDL